MSDLVSDFQSGDGIQMMLTGAKPGARMVVALMTLRRHHPDILVSVLVGDDEAAGIVNHIVADDRLGSVAQVRWDAPRGSKGIAHANKSRLFEFSPFERTVFLDADVAVLAPINEMLPRAGTEEVRLTQFCDWVTTGRRIAKRIEQYRDVLPDKVAMLASYAYPSVNTGVFGYTSLSSGYFAELRRVCELKKVHMADELAAQLIVFGFPHVIMDDRFNWSPVYSSSPEDESRIVHFHGDGHCRESKGIGWRIWRPLFREAWDRNLAGIREWAPAGDRHLRRWMEKENIKP